MPGFLGWRKRKRQVVVAVVYAPERKGYFLAFNRRWESYSLPTKQWPNEESNDPVVLRSACERTALEAVGEDIGQPLPKDAEAIWMEHLKIEGKSGSTDIVTSYEYDVVMVDPKIPLPEGQFGSLRGLMTYQEVLESDDQLVTWSTRAILEKLLQGQHVGLAVICRRTARGREYLMVPNRYGKWFFPAKRQRDYETLDKAVVAEFRSNANYLGEIVPEEKAQVTVFQQTGHLGQRQYVFHLFKTTFPRQDLLVKDNLLETALHEAEIPTRWVSENELGKENLPDWLSPTVKGLRDEVLKIPCG